MASGLKQIKSHVKSVANIQKITTSMKMVAAARFFQAEKVLAPARPLGRGAKYFYEHAPIKHDKSRPAQHLIAITSDRGLCGSCHMKVCKATKLIASSKELEHKVMCIGEKSKAILAFDIPKLIFLVVQGIGHRPPTFRKGSRMALKLLEQDDFYQGILISTLFKNMLSFDVMTTSVYSWLVLKGSPNIHIYDIEGDLTTQAYVEFSISALIYYCLCEAYAVELSARITAMSSASKNAGELKKRLMFQYNRMRQNLVTKELIDIVSGADVVTKRRK